MTPDTRIVVLNSDDSVEPSPWPSPLHLRSPNFNALKPRSTCLGSRVEHAAILDMSCWLIDISYSGMGLISQEPAGGRFHVSFAPVLPREITLPINLVRCQQVLSRTYRLAAVFDGAD